MDVKSTNAGPVHWDPYNPQYFANPYPVFRRLREEAPLYYNEEYDFYAVSRYDDVMRGLSDRDTFISGQGSVLDIIKQKVPIPDGLFIFQDPPKHTTYRGLLNKVFTPRRVAEIEDKIRLFCANALDPLVAGGEFNFIDDLGLEMPLRVIGMVLGIPDEDLKEVQRRGNEKMRTEPGQPQTNHDLTGESFDDYVEWRVTHPSDDLMTELLNLEFTDYAGEKRRLRRQEITVMVNVLAGAGNETTNRLIGWTGKVLAEHPDQRRQIYENRALIPQAIEEILRFEPPGPSIARVLSKDAEFHGVTVPKGSALLCIAAAANRDESKFKDGEQFNIHRERVPHMTFGYGFHACIGNALARIEGRIALEEILNRFPEWDVDLENAYLSSTSTVRGWETLPAYTPKAKRGSRPKPVAASQVGVGKPAGAEGWTMTLKTPMGPQELTMYIVRDGESFTGRIEGKMGSEPIGDGKIAGDTLSWTMDVKKPTAIKLTFEAKIEGDTITGHGKLGMFGKAELTGQRIKS
jgi:cytochrome P450